MRAGRPIHFAAMFGHVELVELLCLWHVLEGLGFVGFRGSGVQVIQGFASRLVGFRLRALGLRVSGFTVIRVLWGLWRGCGV